MSKLSKSESSKNKDLGDQPFSEAVSGITPLVQDKIIPSSDKNRTFVKRTTKDNNQNSLISEISDDYDPFTDEQERYNLNYHHCSISKKRFRDLKNKPFKADLILDLHGCTREQAKIELIDFLIHCKNNNFNRLEVIPGQGHGVLRTSLNLWLRQLPQVLAFAESPQYSGGKGVVRLLITKNHSDD